MRSLILLPLLLLMACSQPVAPVVIDHATLALKNDCNRSNAVGVIDTVGDGDPSHMVWMTSDSGLSLGSTSRTITLTPGRYYAVYVMFPTIPSELYVVAPAVGVVLDASCTDVIPE